MRKMKKIGILTSGGDAPGMNAAIRSAVRTAHYHQIEPIGISEGFNGLVNKQFNTLSNHDVSNILQRGGTILRSARSASFRTQEGRKQAHQHLSESGIEGLVIIGGDGSFTGAHIFFKEFGIPFIGVPGTIDNDLYGTDFTLGFDTACNTVIDAVDRIKDTAASHNRLFFIEVMGRDSGYIALNTGIATGAEEILLPETATNVDHLIQRLEDAHRQRKNSSIVIVAEGDDGGGAAKIAAEVQAKYHHYDTRVTILGHLQRGGKPSAMDRVLGSRLGYEAVDQLISGTSDVMVGIKNGEIVPVPIHDAINRTKPLKQHLFQIKNALI